MRFNLVASLAVLLGASFAQAQVAPAMDVEYFHQAPAGVFEIRPHVNYTGLNAKALSGGIDTKVNGIADLGARFEYGFNEMFSFYGDLSVSMLETKTGNGGTPQVEATTKSSGLDDIELGFRGMNAMGMGSLRYGLALNLGLENRKIENGNPIAGSNNSSGGFGLMPYVGYDMAVGPGFWGAKLSYWWMGERSVDNSFNGTVNSGKMKEGHVLGLGTFYEYLLSDMILGGRLQYDMPSNSKLGGFPGQTSDVSLETSNSLTLGVYTRIPMGPGVLLAGFDYMFLTGKKLYASTGDNTDGVNAWNLNVGYRIAF